MPKPDPNWLLPEIALVIHDKQIQEHGGLAGIRDKVALDSALNRPINYYSYGEADIFVPAAKYAAGIIKNHPFLDGNKRTGFLLAFVFLFINNFELVATEIDAALITKALAANSITEEEFAIWLKDNSQPVSLKT